MPLLGLSGAFAAMGAIYFPATLAPFFGASWRQMDRRPATRADPQSEPVTVATAAAAA